MHHTLTIPTDKYDAVGLLLTTKDADYVPDDTLHISKEGTREQRSYTIVAVHTEGMYKGLCSLQLSKLVEEVPPFIGGGPDKNDITG